MIAPRTLFTVISQAILFPKGSVDELHRERTGTGFDLVLEFNYTSCDVDRLLAA